MHSKILQRSNLSLGKVFCTRNMKTLLLLFVLSISSFVYAIEVCVAPIPSATTGEISLLNPTARKKPYAFTLKIGTKTYAQESRIARCYNNEGSNPLPVVIYDNGVPKESFTINPQKYSNGACIWYKPLYNTWSVWALDKSKHLCRNHTEQGKVGTVHRVSS